MAGVVMNFKKEDVMKNLFVILAVLAMITFASAASVSLVPSSASVLSGTTITVSLIADTDITALTIDGIGDDADNDQCMGNLTMAAILTGARGLGDVVNSGSALVEWISGTVGGTGQKVNAGDVIWSMDYKVIGNVGDTINIMALSGGDYESPNIVFYDNTTTGTIGQAEITITPEPMTIALLGLGGLFLRRKLS